MGDILGDVASRIAFGVETDVGNRQGRGCVGVEGMGRRKAGLSSLEGFAEQGGRLAAGNREMVVHS